MIHLILNDDQTIKAALHESCGIPEEAHVDVEEAAWAAVAGFDHARIRYEEGTLVVDDQAIKDAKNAQLKIQIARIEATQGRAIREAALTGDLTRLQAIEDQIAELRKGL